jgi:hypothetical protein
VIIHIKILHVIYSNEFIKNYLARYCYLFFSCFFQISFSNNSSIYIFLLINVHANYCKMKLVSLLPTSSYKILTPFNYFISFQFMIVYFHYSLLIIWWSLTILPLKIKWKFPIILFPVTLSNYLLFVKFYHFPFHRDWISYSDRYWLKT